MSALILVLGAGLAVLGGLTSLVLAILALAGRSHPPALSVVLWLLPGGVVVLGARQITHSAITEAVRAGELHDWALSVAAQAAPAWNAAQTAGLVVAALAILPLILAAIAGAVRGPRRPWLAVSMLGWTLAGSAMVGAAQLGVMADTHSSAALWLPIAVLLLGCLVAVAGLAGGERSGAAAVELAASTAAAVVTGGAIAVLAGSEASILGAIATAPASMTSTLVLGGHFSHGLAQLGLVFAGITAAGWVALALGARRSAAAGWIGPAAAVAATLLVPLPILGASAVDLLSVPQQALALVPRPRVPDDVELPRVDALPLEGSPLRRGLGLAVLGLDGVRWARSGAGPLLIDGELDRPFLDQHWPEDEAVPVAVDARLPVGAVMPRLDVIRRDRDELLLVVETRPRFDGDEPQLTSLRLGVAAPDAEPSVHLDLETLRASGCLHAPCSQQALGAALMRRGRGGSRSTMTVDGRVPFGLVARAAAVESILSSTAIRVLPPPDPPTDQPPD